MYPQYNNNFKKIKKQTKKMDLKDIYSIKNISLKAMPFVEDLQLQYQKQHA
jgi:hypothetical protein